MKLINLMLFAIILFSSCNESGRGVGGDASATNKSANDANDDKFAGKKQRDAEFVYDVIQSSYGEIKLAGLGNQKSRNADVKKIAQKMLSDHTALLNELKTLAQSKAISVPVEETQTAKRLLEEIAGETDPDFDKAWCRQMRELQEKNIRSYESRLDDTADAELRSFIDKTLPVLREHLDYLLACENRLDNASR